MAQPGRNPSLRDSLNPQKNPMPPENVDLELQNPEPVVSSPRSAATSAAGRSASERVKETAGEMLQMYTSIKKRGYHDLDANELVIYKKLMDHLDRVERKHSSQICTYSLIAAEVVVVVSLSVFLVSSLTLDQLNQRRALELRWWQWITMAMMVFAGASVVRFVSWMVLWPVTWWWRLNRYVVYIVRRLKRCLDVTVWFCLVLLGWYVWFRPRLKHVRGDVSVIAARQITRLLIAICLGSFLWLLKNALYLKLEADLHYHQLFDRIQNSVGYLNGICILNAPYPNGIPSSGASKQPANGIRSSDAPDQPANGIRSSDAPDPPANGIPSSDASDTPANSIPSSDASDPPANGIPSSDASGQPANGNPSSEAPDQPANGRSDASKPPTDTFLRYDTKQKWYKSMTILSRITTVETEKTEEVKNIWMDVIRMNKETVPIWIIRRLEKEYLRLMKTSIKPSNADELLQDDEALLKEAEKMFKSITGIKGKKEIDQFDEIERGQPEIDKYKLSKPELDFLFKRKSGEVETSPKTISHDQFFDWAVRAHKNSWGLERTLWSSKLALIKLNRLLSTFLLAVVLIIYLILTKIVTTAQLALLFAPFLAVSFVFENSLKNMFHGLIFVFAMHPFDVGDRVVINDAQLRVKELNILTSVFFKYDTGSDVIYPNSKLATMSIVNLDITPDQSDKLDFVVNADTPPEDVKDLELRIQEWLDDDNRYSLGTKVVKCTECSFSNKEPLKMTVHFKYLVSYLTAGKKADHKSDILSHILKFRKEMEGNRKEYPHEYEPYSIEFTLKKAKLKQIKDIKRKIMSCSTVKDHYPESKVVIAALDSKRMTMALYVRKTKYKEKDEEKKSDETEANTHHESESEDMSVEEESEFLKELSNKLKEVEKCPVMEKVVKHGKVVHKQNWDKVRSSVQSEHEGDQTAQAHIHGGLESAPTTPQAQMRTVSKINVAVASD